MKVCLLTEEQRKVWEREKCWKTWKITKCRILYLPNKTSNSSLMHPHWMMWEVQYYRINDHAVTKGVKLKDYYIHTTNFIQDRYNSLIIRHEYPHLMLLQKWARNQCYGSYFRSVMYRNVEAQRKINLFITCIVHFQLTNKSTCYNLKERITSRTS